MARLIAAHDSQNAAIVGPDDATLSRIIFRLLRLERDEVFRLREPGHELCLVPMTGQVDVEVDDIAFAALGDRSDVFAGLADSLYVPPGASVSIRAGGSCEIAVAGALAAPDEAGSAFRIPPGDVEEVDVGSPETHSRRRIRHILGQRQNGRVQRLLVSELYADPGCWSGYPPHKHDTDEENEETDHEELYHYRFDPPTGFGNQLCYAADGSPQAFVTRHGDTFCLDRGYHPTVTSPGHQGYIFTILSGRSQRGLIQRFEPAHTHLMDAIPGIQGMRDAFK